jgi:cytochrome b561
MTHNRFARSQRITIVNGALVLTVVLVVLQLWLLTATMNAFLGGDTETSVPATLVSLGCLVVNLWLLRHLYRLD